MVGSTQGMGAVGGCGVLRWGCRDGGGCGGASREWGAEMGLGVQGGGGGFCMGNRTEGETEARGSREHRMVPMWGERSIGQQGQRLGWGLQ